MSQATGLRRRTSKAPRKHRIDVFPEGRLTEPQYLQAWAREHRSRVLLNIRTDLAGYAPYQLVEAAVQQQSHDAREASRGRGEAADSYWCVFDVDEHPRLPEALALAAKNGIRTAVSNPCFELWLLLHHVDQRSWISRQDAQHQLKSLTGIKKTLGPADLKNFLASFDSAKARAQALRKTHQASGASDHNPGSDVWRLVDQIRAHGQT